MEMQSNPTPPPPAQGAVSVTNPAPVAASTEGGQTSPTLAMAATPVMANGGEVKSSGFFSGINWLEMGFLILGSAALFTLIYYHTQDLKKKKVTDSRLDALNRQVDEIKMNVKPALKGKYKEIQ